MFKPGRLAPEAMSCIACCDLDIEPEVPASQAVICQHGVRGDRHRLPETPVMRPPLPSVASAAPRQGVTPLALPLPLQPGGRQLLYASLQGLLRYRDCVTDSQAF